MSKCGLVAYSDGLRLEHGDSISVTTVYPDYVRTPIHHAPAGKGVSLEGVVPAERLEDAAQTLCRAALGRPVRELATTRRGALADALLRLLPSKLVDRAVLARFRRVEAGFRSSAGAS
jgi:NAD(P)-dependent dehydrogenase (short-subunit alcohol dehydrogenase family)